MWNAKLFQTLCNNDKTEMKGDFHNQSIKKADEEFKNVVYIMI